MIDYQKYIEALRKCAKEHEYDRTPTGDIIVSYLCRDVADLLEALEKESCEDCVSRKVAKENALNLCLETSYDNEKVVEMLDDLPSVKPVACIGTVKFSKEDMQKIVDDAVKELKTMTDDRAICKDCVDMSDVISMIMNLNLKHIHSFSRGIGQKAFEDLLNETQALPTVRPTQRKGKWITKFHGFPAEPTTVCSECGFDRDFNIHTRSFGKIKYCPNCGRRMTNS